MSKPALTKINPGPVPVQIKTMFYTEGNPMALLVENRAGRHIENKITFDNAQLALAWCRRNGCNLYYIATNITAQ